MLYGKNKRDLPAEPNNLYYIDEAKYAEDLKQNCNNIDKLSNLSAEFCALSGIILAVVAMCGVVPAHGMADAPTRQGARKAELERRLAGPDGHVMVVAHRACWKGTSENSIDAIEACIAAGVDMVEIDLRATRDGKLVLLHDATVDRMTDGTGVIADMDWDEVRKLRLREGQGRGTPLTDRHIPTFEDVLRVAKDRILINVDAKIIPPAGLLELIDRISDRRQILFKAEAPVADILAVAPWVREVRFQPILREPSMGADPRAAIAAYDPLRPAGYEIDIKHQPFAPGLTPVIRHRCARYWIDTLSGRAFDDRAAMASPDAVWGQMIGFGVDAIQTDEPVALAAYLRRNRSHSFRCEPEPSPVPAPATTP